MRWRLYASGTGSTRAWHLITQRYTLIAEDSTRPAQSAIGFYQRGPAAHPFMDITAEKAPMFSDFRGRQFADSCELVYRGFRDPQKPCHIDDGQDLAIPRKGITPSERCCFRCGVLHSTCTIGMAA